MKSRLNQLIDQALVEEIERLISQSPTGEYAHADAKEAVVSRIDAADFEDLKVAAVEARFRDYKTRATQAARSTAQQGLPGDFAPPEGEFHFGDIGVPKAKASHDHWLRWIQQKVDHISEAQAALQAQLAEFTAYAPYLSQGMTTLEAYEQYHRDHPEFGANSAAAD